MDADAENTFRVFDWLWTSGQLSERDIARLPELGIAAVVNLAPPTSSNALKGEAELVAGRGIAYLQLPVDWENPDPARFEQFAALLQALEGKNVWVHCAKNMRVSAFIYLYRKLVRGESEQDARFPMREV